MVDSGSPTYMSPENQPSASMPTNQVVEQRKTVFKTKEGTVPADEVKLIAQQNIAADAHLIKMISSNQSQEYFAVATTQGFEIIQNDSSS
jgi:hypothetical protein